MVSHSGRHQGGFDLGEGEEEEEDREEASHVIEAVKADVGGGGKTLSLLTLEWTCCQNELFHSTLREKTFSFLAFSWRDVQKVGGRRRL